MNDYDESDLTTDSFDCASAETSAAYESFARDTLDTSWHPPNSSYRETDIDEEELSSDEDLNDDVGDGETVDTLNENCKVVLAETDQLEELLSVCRQCTGKNTISKKKFGSMVIFECICNEGHKYTWRSSKCANGTPLVNTSLAASIFCSGISFYSFQRLAATLDLVFFSEKTYYNHINFYLSPVIQTKWFDMRRTQIDSMRNGEEKWKVCGDGKFDSPGVNSAKYCIYTLMSVCGRILDFVVFQKGLAPGEMEGKAFQFVFKRILDEVGESKISLFCSDRSMVVAKLMRVNFPRVNHAFDVIINLFQNIPD